MVRFILAVVDGSLRVSNRKRTEVVGDLAAMGFDRANVVAKKVRSGVVVVVVVGALVEAAQRRWT
eukprot:354903-Chlamydomonas_euryale.AAC.26